LSGIYVTDIPDMSYKDRVLRPLEEMIAPQFRDAGIGQKALLSDGLTDDQMKDLSSLYTAISGYESLLQSIYKQEFPVNDKCVPDPSKSKTYQELDEEHKTSLIEVLQFEKYVKGP